MEDLNRQTFQKNINWFINFFKNQYLLVSQQLPYETEKNIATEVFKNIFIVALNNIDESDAETFYWVLHHLDITIYIDIKRDIATIIAQKLIEKGYILGKDFSCTPTGNVILNQKSAAALSKNSHICHPLLLGEILQQL